MSHVESITISRTSNAKYLIDVKGLVSLDGIEEVAVVHTYCYDSLQEVFEQADKLFSSD